MSGYTKGQEVTNGHWVACVLASHGDWVWVQPLWMRDGKKLTINDGPLTFRQSDLERIV